MSGIITRWFNENHRTVAWAREDMTIVRLGFIHRKDCASSWVPVVQAGGQLLPFAPTLGLSWAVRQIVAYHDTAGTIDARGYTPAPPGMSMRLP